MRIFYQNAFGLAQEVALLGVNPNNILVKIT
jgi:hypothetical protein